MFASKDPTYDQCFTFFVHSVNNQVLNVEVNLSKNHNIFYNIKQQTILAPPYTKLDKYDKHQELMVLLYRKLCLSFFYPVASGKRTR